MITFELSPAHLLERAELVRGDVERQLDPDRRGQMGQFFTPRRVSELMASMLGPVPDTLLVLDAGAGIGSLSAALVAEICSRPDKPHSLRISAFEIDPALADYLRITLEDCKRVSWAAGIEFAYEIHREDFVASTTRIIRDQGTFFARPPYLYDVAILNPPYHKISTNSSIRQQLASAGIETSNLYTAFLWLAIRMLVPNGQVISITPRSFCNGPYFRPFRKALLERMSLRRIHVYESRKEAFAEGDVLQENIILHAVQSSDRTAPVIISTSSGSSDDVTIRGVPFEQVVQPDDRDLFIHIIPDELGSKVSATIHTLRHSLRDLSLDISTGRVVEFRAKSLLRAHPSEGTFPLIYPRNLSGGRVEWPRPGGKKPVALSGEPGVQELLVPSDFYVLVKRFSAKEERRRVMAAVYDPRQISADRVGFENHLNYFHCQGQGLSRDLAKGLTAFLNSTLVDEYFRQFNGHTQVNAADLVNLRYPSREQLLTLGARVGNVSLDQDELDRIVNEELELAKSLDASASDPLQAKKKIDEALGILQALGLPRAQQNRRSALTLLALLGLRPETPWSEASAPLLGITEMMNVFSRDYGVTYAPNTRETVRRQTIHQFVQAGIALENPDEPRPVNSPKTRYQIEPRALELIKSFGSAKWKKHLPIYVQSAEPLTRLQVRERNMARVPVRMSDGVERYLSGGRHNILIKHVIEEFCPRFTPAGKIIYVGDVGDKLQGTEVLALKRLGVEIDEHGKMPDIIVHYSAKNWLVLIEAVTSHGPVDIKRHNELKKIYGKSRAGLVFVTAFETRAAMVKYLREIAWETEVWIAESPTHLIHFNGERFLGPYP